MSHYITDTTDEQISLLVVASPLFMPVVKKVFSSTTEFNIQIRSLSDFASDADELVKYSWYKVLFFLDPVEVGGGWPFIKNEASQSLLKSALIIFPLTTAVQPDGQSSEEWISAIEKEVTGFNNLEENIDISNFIFYENGIVKNTYPLRFFIQLSGAGFILDPQLSIRLLSLEAVVNQVKKTLFAPARKPRFFRGKSIKSSEIVRIIADLYERYHQREFTARQRPQVITPHPVLLRRDEPVEEIELPVNVQDELSEWVKKTQLVEIETKPLSSIEAPVKEIKNVAPVVIKHQFITEPESVLEIEREPELKPILEPENVKETVDVLFSDYRTQQKQTHLEQLVKETHKGKRKVARHKTLFTGGLGVMGLGLGLLALLGIVMLRTAQLEGQFLAYLGSLSQPTTAQEKRLETLATSSRWISGQLQFVSSTLSLPLFSKTAALSEAVTHLLNTYAQQKEVRQQTIDWYAQIMDSGSSQSLGKLTELHTGADKLYQELSLTIGELKNVSTDNMSAGEKQQLSSFQQDLEKRQQSLVKFKQLYPLLPTLLGSEQKRTYAFVLQNEQELRPTGGFIQAVALVSFQEGKVVNVTVEDIYQLDQQLSVFLEPPNEIKQFLGEQRWYIRDSNWNADFPQAAERMSWLLERSVNQPIDGVVVLNIETLEKMLQVTGQVSLPEYNEVATQQNINERMEFYSEIQLVNKAERPEYAELVLREMIKTLQALPADKVVPLLSSLEEAANEKELLVYMSRSPELATFNSLGWSGAIVQPNCPTLFGTAPCMVDSVYQVEANVGVNKANYYLQRQVDHSIEVLTDQIRHKRAITFKNTAQSNAWPKGPYRAFTRVYVDPTAMLTAITVDGKALPADQITITQENSRLVWGIVTETPVQKETKIEVTYTLPHSQTKPFTYVFFDQKQPGARDVSPRIFMTHDPRLTPTLIAPQADVQGNVIVFNPSVDTGHLFVGATFQ
jgi:hypothetical protein